MGLFSGAHTPPRKGKNKIPQKADDESGYWHRQLIGYLGISLPLIVFLISGMRTAAGPDRWKVLDSVSAYYYTGAVAAFVGVLVALALVLLTYKGFQNKYQFYDRAAAIIGGLAALGVAFFPMKAPEEKLKPVWWEPSTGHLHFISAAILFSMFALFSLWLFRIDTSGDPMNKGKRVRNAMHLLCGFMIVASMAWARVNSMAEKPILVPEAVALFAFGISWLVKGRADKSISLTLKQLFRK